MKYTGHISQKIYDTAIEDGMPDTLAQLIVAQAKHETGGFTSKFFKVYLNCFGYSKTGSKWQLHIQTPNADNAAPIAAYSSIENSVHELTDWIKRRQKEKKFPSDLATITVPDIYVGLLKQCGYFGDTLANYLAGVKHYLQDMS